MRWRVDTQDSPVVPSGGWLSEVQLSRIFDGPDVAMGEEAFDIESSLTQLSGVANHFWSIGPPNRVFVYGGFGTSFDSVPLPTNQFALGTPFRLVRTTRASSGALTTTSRPLDICGEWVGFLTSSAVRYSQEDGLRTGMPSTSGRKPA